jgi:hypothetical protein
MYVIGERDFEIWCKARVLEQPPGTYTCGWEIGLNMIETTCLQEAIFSLHVARQGEIPPEFEIKDDRAPEGRGR